MSKRHTKDYMALQSAWNICVMRYLSVSPDSVERVNVMDDFRDSLIDIKETGNEALRSNYEEWEQDEWMLEVNQNLAIWVKHNSFEAKEEDSFRRQEIIIKKNLNYKRFRKIMQIIQDSGIGLGQGGSGRGYDVGPDNIEKFTG